MNLNELITNNITIVVSIIIIMIIVSLVLMLIMLKSTELRCENIEAQNAKLNDQVRTYSSNLARLYEQEKFIDEDHDQEANEIPEPNLEELNNMPDMNVNEKEEEEKDDNESKE